MHSAKQKRDMTDAFFEFYDTPSLGRYPKEIYVLKTDGTKAVCGRY
jgi:hypothetical protein